MPTQLPPNLTPAQEKMYILQLQIEDITRRLKTGDLGIPANPEDRYVTGAKIIIRGKGSVKDGKLIRRDGMPIPGEDEPLHAFVSAATPESCQKAVEKIQSIIRQGIEVPEGFGHLASDCKLRDPSVTMEHMGINPMERAKMDSEYTALMAELGVGYGGGAATLPPGVARVDAHRGLNVAEFVCFSSGKWCEI
ncbi:Splicing factor [Echinococcus granulosus]|uniref:Branchpoint-bridging protein n=1 Tax=Echinococcus granulosus TaxID=6210 RepID=W6UGR3_ECHGR|nr:Splicing factor [Echinococcus granulosus]EUB57307.1 Splicing factor [Echinococcus granulosus]